MKSTETNLETFFIKNLSDTDNVQSMRNNIIITKMRSKRHTDRKLNILTRLSVFIIIGISNKPGMVLRRGHGTTAPSKG